MTYLRYKFILSYLLKKHQYCILGSPLELWIWYKEIIPKSEGECISYNNETLNQIYDKYNKPFSYIIIMNKNIYEETDIDYSQLPLKCFKVKLIKNYINKLLNTNYQTFEEEIYKLIACLNTDPTKLSEMLYKSFEDCTRFIPIKIDLFVKEYVIKPIEWVCVNYANCFGPQKATIFHPRLIDGHLADPTWDTGLLSLRNHFEWKKKNEISENIKKYLDYTIHLYKYENKYAYIPLAFNPFENPII